MGIQASRISIALTTAAEITRRLSHHEGGFPSLTFSSGIITMTPASRHTTPLRQRTIEDMKIRNLSPHTIQAYVDLAAAFAKHFGKSPQLMASEGSSDLPRFPCRGEACLMELLRPSDLVPRDFLIA